MKTLPFSPSSGISVTCSRFTVCSLFQENKIIVISAKSIKEICCEHCGQRKVSEKLQGYKVSHGPSLKGCL